MAETGENPILAFFSNLFRGIKLPLPKNDAVVEPANDVVAAAAEPMEKKPAASESEVTNPSSVKFPTQGFDSLKLETESVEGGPDTNPILVWQVYAIGGFFILRWAWTRWNERKGRKKSDNEPPTDPDNL